jgi:hypothetical protein
MKSGSFAGYPRSVNEWRARRSGDAADWSPREALIAVLRSLDEGVLQPDALVVCYREQREHGSRSSFVAACPDCTVMLGLLEAAKFRIWEGGQ